jgi:hypothetical protein
MVDLKANAENVYPDFMALNADIDQALAEGARVMLETVKNGGYFLHAQ